MLDFFIHLNEITFALSIIFAMILTAIYLNNPKNFDIKVLISVMATHVVVFEMLNLLLNSQSLIIYILTEMDLASIGYFLRIIFCSSAFGFFMWELIKRLSKSDLVTDERLAVKVSVACAFSIPPFIFCIFMLSALASV